MRILESSYSTAILLYVAERGQCKKTDIYDHTTHGTTMPRKIDELENAGLLVQEKGDKMTLVRPTEKGARVAQLLAEIRDLIVSGGEAGEGRRGHAKSEIGVSVHDLGQPQGLRQLEGPVVHPLVPRIPLVLLPLFLICPHADAYIGSAPALRIKE